MPRSFVYLFIAGLLAVPAAGAERPNILLVTADDLGVQLSCYGERRIRTPRLDALAAAGVRFDNAYVAQASCSSSRAALLTGLYPHQNGQYGLAHLGFSMPSGQKTLPALLQGAGYYTGIIGKLHVEPAADFPFDWRSKRHGGKATQQVRQVAVESRAFFAAAAAAKRPFFYYVNYFDPHGPYTPEVDQIDDLPAKPLDATAVEPLDFAGSDGARRQQTARFYNCVARLDEGVGLLLEELARAGAADNTLVVFLGDNGAPVRRGKTTCYESGVRVPLLLRGPGIAPGGVRRQLVSAVDIMPTLLEAAGVAPPAGLAGQSLEPLLAADIPGRAVLFCEMNFHAANNYLPQRAARDARYKLVHNLLPGAEEWELFDLQTDPGETKNLAGDATRAATLARLRAALEQWRAETADPLVDAARRARWQAAAEKWRTSAPRLQRGPYPNVALVPAGELRLLE